jgi:hypothetical protein
MTAEQDEAMAPCVKRQRAIGIKKEEGDFSPVYSVLRMIPFTFQIRT